MLAVVLFDASGTEPQRQLPATGVSWLDDLDAEGSFSFRVAVEDAPELAIGSVVKFALGAASNDYVFAGVVDNLRIQRVGSDTEGGARAWDVSGRGIRARLDEAVVYPVGTDNVRPFTDKTAGEIFRTLFLEAQARGALTGLSVDFTNSTDSNGQPFTDTLTIDEGVGVTLLEVASGHQELAVDVWVTPDLVVHYANQRGEDRTDGGNPVVLRAGYSVSELSAEQAGPVKNTVLVAVGGTNTSYTTKTDAASVAEYGRRETYLSLANSDDAAFVNLSTERIFTTTATPADGVTVQLSDNGPTPYSEFFVGDTVFLVDETGARTSYRVRGITVQQGDAGELSFVPELGTARADLDRRLARVLLRAERGKADGESVVGTTPGDIDIIGGGGAEFETGEVVSYDPITGDGTVDIGGSIEDFHNVTPWTFEPGDSIVVGSTAGGGFLGLGLSAPSGGAGPGTGGTQFGYTAPQLVPGLPYTPGIELGSVDSTGEGFVLFDTTVVDFVAPLVFTLPVPVGFVSGGNNGHGFSRLQTGTFVYRRTSSSSTNSLCVITNGVVTIHNYGGVALLGRSRGLIYGLATHKNGTAGNRVITVDNTGAVSDFVPTFVPDGGGVTSLSFNFDQPGGAGYWGVAWRTNSTPTRIQVLAFGETSGKDYSFGGAGVDTAPFTPMAIDGTYIYGLSSSNPRRWHKTNANTGIRVVYNDHLPLGASGNTIAHDGGSGNIVIAGAYDDGMGDVPALFTTNGGPVTTTTYPDTGGIVLYNTPDGLIQGVKYYISPELDQIIGVGLTGG